MAARSAVMRKKVTPRPRAMAEAVPSAGKSRSSFPFVEMHLIGSIACDDRGVSQQERHAPVRLKPQYSDADFVQKGAAKSLTGAFQRDFRPSEMEVRSPFSQRTTADPKFQCLLKFCIDKCVFAKSPDSEDIPVLFISKRSVMTTLGMTRQRARSHEVSALRGYDVVDTGFGVAACMIQTSDRVVVLIDHWNHPDRAYVFDATKSRIEKEVKRESTVREDDLVHVSFTSGLLNASTNEPPYGLVLSAEGDTTTLIDGQAKRVEIKSELLTAHGGPSDFRMANYVVACSLAGIRHLVHSISRTVNGDLQTTVRMKEVDKELTRSHVREKYTCAMKTLHQLLGKIVARLQGLGEGMTLLVHIRSGQTEPHFSWQNGTDLLMTDDVKKRVYKQADSHTGGL